MSRDMVDVVSRPAIVADRKEMKMLATQVPTNLQGDREGYSHR